VAHVIGIDARIERKLYPGADVPALLDCRLRVDASQFVALVGPSGCGKSTLLNIVGGLDRDLSGAVSLGGLAVGDAAAGGLAIGYMFQEPRLMPWLTALENLLLVLEESPGAEQTARQLLAQVDLEDFADAFPGQLSGGMSRRLSLARAFSVDPKLLLMDEPFVSVDAPTAARLRRQLTDLWMLRRPTVLFVTHDLREALALADRVVFMSGRPGSIVFDFTVKLPHPRDPEDPSITALRGDILAKHPQLLSGIEGLEHQPGADQRNDEEVA
jgi:NitT/TauT family transport system ATP-binding protein